MNLIVDVGNTLVKFAIYKDAELIHKVSFELSEFKKQYEKLKKEFPKVKLAIISSVEGRTTLFVRILICGLWPQTHIGSCGGHEHPFSKAFNCCFTMRSSREWNESTHRRPPGFKKSAAHSMKVFSLSSS